MNPLPRHTMLENRRRLDAKTLHEWLGMLQTGGMSPACLELWTRSLPVLEAADWATLGTMAATMFNLGVRKGDEAGESAARILRAVANYGRCKPLRPVLTDLDNAFLHEITWPGVFNRPLALAVQGGVCEDALDTGRAIAAYSQACRLLDSIGTLIWEKMGQEGFSATDRLIVELASRARTLIPQPYVDVTSS